MSERAEKKQKNPHKLVMRETWDEIETITKNLFANARRELNKHARI